MTKAVAVRLTAEQKEQLETLAKKQKVNVSDFIRNLLEKESPRSPQEEIEELQTEAERIKAQIAEIERAEQEKRIAEEERQRQAALAELARQYDDLIEKVEQDDVQAAALKEKYLGLGGDFDGLWTEIMDGIERVELSENAKQLLEQVRSQRASWVQRADSPLRFLDTRLIAEGFEI